MAQPTPFDLLIGLVATVGSFVVAIIILVRVRRWLTRLAGKTKTRIDDYAATLFKGPLTILILVVTGIAALRYWDSLFPEIIPPQISLNLDAAISVVAVLVATSIIALLVNVVVGQQMKKIIELNPASEMSFRLILRLTLAGIYIIGVLAALSTAFPGLTGSLTTLLFGAGFLGIVIGLAAQRVIGNLLSGVNVNISKPIKLGDAVLINNEFGFVEDMTLRHTVIRTWDNRRMIIPNSILDDQVIVNYSMTDSRKLFPVTVGVPYDTNIEEVADIMVSEARNHPNVLKDLDPIFQVLDFADGSITLRLLFMAKDQGTAFGTACDLRRMIKKRFDEEGIRFSTPVRYVVTTPGQNPTDVARSAATD